MNFVDFDVDKSFFDKFIKTSSGVFFNGRMLKPNENNFLRYEDIGRCFIFLERDLSAVSENTKIIHNYDNFYFIYHRSSKFRLLVFKESIVAGYPVRVAYLYSDIHEGMGLYTSILYKRFKAKNKKEFNLKLSLCLKKIELSVVIEKFPILDGAVVVSSESLNENEEPTDSSSSDFKI